MSGPSGGGGNWVNEPTDDCSKLSEVTTLNSPDKATEKLRQALPQPFGNPYLLAVLTVSAPRAR